MYRRIDVYGLLLAHYSNRFHSLCKIMSSVPGSWGPQSRALRGELNPANISWPFAWWGFDVIGPVNPTSSKGHAYVLAATDSFSKWAEAVALHKVDAKEVVE